MSGEVADKLAEARALIERGWTQGALARDANGHEIEPESALATCFCMSGAVLLVDDNAWTGSWTGSFWFLRKVIDGHIIPHWNDAPERTQAEVLAAFDKAIELAEKSS